MKQNISRVDLSEINEYKARNDRGKIERGNTFSTGGCFGRFWKRIDNGAAISGGNRPILRNQRWGGGGGVTANGRRSGSSRVTTRRRRRRLFRSWGHCKGFTSSPIPQRKISLQFTDIQHSLFFFFFFTTLWSPKKTNTGIPLIYYRNKGRKKGVVLVERNVKREKQRKVWSGGQEELGSERERGVLCSRFYIQRGRWWCTTCAKRDVKFWEDNKVFFFVLFFCKMEI